MVVGQADVLAVLGREVGIGSGPALRLRRGHVPRPTALATVKVPEYVVPLAVGSRESWLCTCWACKGARKPVCYAAR